MRTRRACTDDGIGLIGAGDLPERLKTAEQSARQGRGRRPLLGEVVADVGVAVGGIKPQAPVERKRVIELVDLRAGVTDGRRNVNTRRRLGQRQRWRA